ncbi:hypothetical protein D3C73_900650 [compost metagenome]
MLRVRMYLAKRRRQPLVGKPAQQTGRGAATGCRPKRLDQQHFEKPRQHHVARRLFLLRFVPDQLNDGGELPFAPHMHQPRQQRYEKACIRGSEGKPADKHAHIGRSIRIAVPGLFIAPGNDEMRGILGIDRLDTRHGKVAGGGDQNEVAGPQFYRFLSGSRQPRSTFEKDAEKRSGRRRRIDAPRAGAARHLRKRQAWLKQGHHICERIGQFRTFKNELRTIDCSTSWLQYLLS